MHDICLSLSPAWAGPYCPLPGTAPTQQGSRPGLLGPGLPFLPIHTSQCLWGHLGDRISGFAPC